MFKKNPRAVLSNNTLQREKVNFMNVIVYLGFPLLWNVITLGFFVTKRRGWIRKTKVNSSKVPRIFIQRLKANDALFRCRLATDRCPCRCHNTKKFCITAVTGDWGRLSFCRQLFFFASISSHKNEVISKGAF